MNTALYAAAALAAALVTTGSLPFWRSWCRRTRHVDDPGLRKIHENPIPLAGGLAMLTGLVVPLLVSIVAVNLRWLDAESVERLQHGFGTRAVQLAAIFGGAFGMTFLGWVDDRYELRASTKFTGQLVIAALVAGSGIRITLFVPSALFSFAITLLWILAVTNAFNFLDNMNGLCAGLGAIAATTLGIKAALLDQYLVAATAFLVAGACLGFLPFNFPKASVFLGDAGSHLIGFLLAVLAILPHFHSKKHPDAWAVLTPLLVLAVPLADLVWVVVLRWRLGKPFHVGDTNHVSHRLTRRGFSRVQAVLLIWAAAAVIGTVALWL